MKDGIPKSRVTLTYDTKVPEGREKPRELPFRLLVLGDLGGNKSGEQAALDNRKVRHLNGRNLGEVMKGLNVKLEVPLGDGDNAEKVKIEVESVSSFSPDDVLQVLTGQKPSNPGSKALKEKWATRQEVVDLIKAYQNSKTLRAALKSVGAPPVDEAEQKTRKEALSALRKTLGVKPAAAQPSNSPAANNTGGE